MEFAFDPKPTTPLAVDRLAINRQHDNDSTSHLALNRRRLLRIGVASIVAAAQTARLLHAKSAPLCAPTIPQDHSPSNGGSCPYPIPWLDKNGNHNQSPMPNVELSNIYRFKAKLARCDGFTGIGTDHQDNR